MSKRITTKFLVGLLVLSPLAAIASEVNVYSARKEKLIKPLLDKFSQETGIKTNLITAKADKLLKRIKSEGQNSPADLFITVDAGRLYRAKQADVLQPIQSNALTDVIPSNLRDPEGYWIGLSQRARVIFYAKDRVKPDMLSTYEALSDAQWKQKVCIRSSNNIYNQSLIASMIASNGIDQTSAWLSDFVKNFARPPSGGDRDQIKAIAAGECDVAVANTYYFGKMVTNKKDASQVEAAGKVAIFWPNQNDRGTHVNVSGAGIAQHAPNKENALKLLTYLTTKESQAWYANVNFEYPVRQDVPESELLKSWGDFKADTLNLSKLGENNKQAVMLMDKAGWK